MFDVELHGAPITSFGCCLFDCMQSSSRNILVSDICEKPEVKVSLLITRFHRDLEEILSKDESDLSDDIFIAIPRKMTDGVADQAEDPRTV